MGSLKRTTKAASQESPWRPLTIRMRPHGLPGTLIVFEGLDGAGKSTTARSLASALTRSGVSCHTTSAPSSDLRSYRPWLLWHQSARARGSLDEFGLTLLALGDRLLLQSEVILPALAQGRVVISDRYVLSILAYWSTRIHAAVLRRLVRPDLVFFCACSAEVAVSRTAKRAEPRLLRDLDFLRCQGERYERLSALYPNHEIRTDSLSRRETLSAVLKVFAANRKPSGTPARQ